MGSEPQKNTSENWDELWNRAASPEDDLWRFARAEREVRWRRLRAIIGEQFGGFDGLKVVEIGAGSGTYSALMAKRGAQVTVLDYSDKALERAGQFFSQHAIAGKLVKANALDLPEDLRGRYDISMSFGLAEHFLGEERSAVLRSHLDLVRPNGLAVISVPNAWNLPYRFYKYIAELRGTWGVVEEYPFTRGELKRFCLSQGIERWQILGSSLLNSIGYFLLGPLGRALGLRGGERHDLDHVPSEIGLPLLDAYFSYALVLCSVKG